MSSKMLKKERKNNACVAKNNDTNEKRKSSLMNLSIP